MQRKSIVFSAACILLSVGMGCSEERNPQSSAALAEKGRQAELNAAENQSLADGNKAAENTGSAEQGSQTPPESNAEEPQTTYESREVTPYDAQKGKGLTGGGYLTEVLRQRFLVEHRLTFLQLKKAQDLYHALHGRHPQTHEEFMKEIVEANQLQLPELEPGWEYFYDAESAELKMRRPVSPG